MPVIGGKMTRSYFVSGILRIPIKKKKAPRVNVRVSVFRCVTKFMQWMPAAGPPPSFALRMRSFAAAKLYTTARCEQRQTQHHWPAEPLNANIRTLYFFLDQIADEAVRNLGKGCFFERMCALVADRLFKSRR